MEMPHRRLECGPRQVGNLTTLTALGLTRASVLRTYHSPSIYFGTKLGVLFNLCVSFTSFSICPVQHPDIGSNNMAPIRKRKANDVGQATSEAAREARNKRARAST